MAVSWLMIACSLVFLNKLYSQSDTTVFEFTEFKSNEPDLIFQGDAILEKIIYLQNAYKIALTSNRVGRVVYSSPIRLWDRVGRRQANFQTVFTAFMCAMEESQVNGISFFIAPVNATIPIASTTGGNMGLYDASSGNSPVPLFAVELDRYVNSWDPNYRHVGININNRNSVAVDWWEWNTTVGSWLPGFPSCYTLVETRITYDARQRLISVIANTTSINFVPQPPPFVGQVEYTYVLKSTRVQIGFSSATEAGGSHDIESWSFISFMVPDEDNYNRQDMRDILLYNVLES